MSALPHTSVPRRDTGFTNGKLGTWLFLAAEVMFFGALFSSYAFLRTAAVTWPSAREALSFPLGLLCELLLIVPAALLYQALANANMLRTAKVRKLAAVAAVLWVAYALFTALQWRFALADGATPDIHNFYGLFYLMTGLLALHGAGLAAWTLWHIASAASWMRKDSRRLAVRLECAAQFAVFLALAGAVNFVLFYIL